MSTIVNQDTALWSRQRIKKDQRDKYLINGRDFIEDSFIYKVLDQDKDPDKKQVESILEKSLQIKTLSAEEAAVLLNVKNPDILEKMQETALKVKQKVYDNRIVTFAPLYLGNRCVNNCLYCGFRKDNNKSFRSVLSPKQIEDEIKVLAGKIGHKRLIVVYGEHPDTDINYMVDSIKRIYSVREKTRKGIGQIRRVNVNAPALSIKELETLKSAGIGTYQVFQETYHRFTYSKLHPQGAPKADYLWRLYAMHRAMEAGIDDVGIGVLFGLYDWKYEVVSLVLHALELERHFGVGPHTISFPRLEIAENVPYTQEAKFKVSDDDFKKLVTVLRLAVPHTGLIITAREKPQIRTDFLKLGYTQTDASTRLGIGSYSEEYNTQQGNRQQFYLGDTRTLDELIREFSQLGFITSFCTAGYRCGRTGECIMELLKSGKEGKLCKLNAVLTFREWLDDFASEQTRSVGEKVIKEEIRQIQKQMPSLYEQFMNSYQKIVQGERDIYF